MPMRSGARPPSLTRSHTAQSRATSAVSAVTNSAREMRPSPLVSSLPKKASKSAALSNGTPSFALRTRVTRAQSVVGRWRAIVGGS
eukprot:752751-Prymnesium_polylepis.2